MKIALLMTLLLIAAAPSDEINLAATANGAPVKIRILRWSTEAEVRLVVTALAAPPAQPSEVARASAAAAGRGAAAAGRGRGRGRGPAPAPLSPIAAFTAALGRAPTIGYIWTDGVTGYAIKYAVHMPLPGGGERMILASDRRLDAAAGTTDYEFTLLELRLGPKGAGEGKVSLTSKVVVDAEAKTVALDNYAAAPPYLLLTAQKIR